MACRCRQQALFEMWADFYQISPGMHPEFFIGGGLLAAALCGVGLIVRSAL